ncbi:hypothetical protein CBW22_02535 [Pantoea sp. VS1]|uniref:DUF29 domain-containing protein n=1 Tax=Pantoea sp. VS1 TaxID=2003658 RepID=UPI000B5112C7|nr:DUF29 domain-containing protein [Pantoea sp. VS1]OWS77027.1 hypothetical protein CBW22_02535 [Pantoea sp. VS1]HAT4500974.1 DUF29 domain-containing protein [Serratia marcescens]HAT4514318.1 DUF29 domain-containing protein [Serratia marcescens]HAT4538297.1 DUF29 domain-containing protein [Serratia marcescens]
MNTRYEADVVAWAQEQAALLRTGRFSEIDVANIAEEIEDVGKSEKRELARRMAVLLAHLLIWKFQPGCRGSSWQRTIKEHRKALALHIKGTPSLKTALSDRDWIAAVWADAVSSATQETQLDVFPEDCIWDMGQILSQKFYPD